MISINLVLDEPMPIPELVKALKRSPDNRDLDYYYISKISFEHICIPYNPLETLIYLYSWGLLKHSDKDFSFCEDSTLQEYEWLETYLISKNIDNINTGSINGL